MKNASIETIMTKNPVSVRIDTTLGEIIRILQDNEFDHLPVIDQAGILVGIISKTDVYNKALELTRVSSGQRYSEKLLSVTKAESIMSLKPSVVSIKHSVDYATELLLQGKFHALPVLDNDLLVGIVTSKDILEFAVDTKRVVL